MSDADTVAAEAILKLIVHAEKRRNVSLGYILQLLQAPNDVESRGKE